MTLASNTIPRTEWSRCCTASVPENSETVTKSSSRSSAVIVVNETCAMRMEVGEASVMAGCLGPPWIRVASSVVFRGNKFCSCRMTRRKSRDTGTIALA